MAAKVAVKSPWAGRDRAAEREEKREAVLLAAARTFAESGYHGTTLDEIAKRLGVTKPTIYYYARNKDELISAAVARALENILPATRTDSGLSALMQLQHLLRRYAETMATDFGRCVTVLRDARISGDGQQIFYEGMREIDRRIRELLALGQEDGSIGPCDPRLTSFMVSSAINGIVRWFDENGPLSASDVADRLVNQLTTGLAPRAEPRATRTGRAPQRP